MPGASTIGSPLTRSPMYLGRWSMDSRTVCWVKRSWRIQDNSGIIWSLWKNNSIAWSQTEVIIAVNHLEKSMLSGGCSLAPLCRPALEQPQEVLRIWKLSAQWGLRWAKLLHNWQVSCCSWWCSVCCQRSLCETLERFQSMFPTCIFHVIHSNMGLYLKSIWQWYQHISTLNFITVIPFPSIRGFSRRLSGAQGTSRGDELQRCPLRGLKCWQTVDLTEIPW
jgi:hypothetical protein